MHCCGRMWAGGCGGGGQGVPAGGAGAAPPRSRTDRTAAVPRGGQATAAERSRAEAANFGCRYEHDARIVWPSRSSALSAAGGAAARVQPSVAMRGAGGRAGASVHTLSSESESDAGSDDDGGRGDYHSTDSDGGRSAGERAGSDADSGSDVESRSSERQDAADLGSAAASAAGATRRARARLLAAGTLLSGAAAARRLLTLADAQGWWSTPTRCQSRTSADARGSSNMYSLSTFKCRESSTCPAQKSSDVKSRAFRTRANSSVDSSPMGLLRARASAVHTG